MNVVATFVDRPFESVDYSFAQLSVGSMLFGSSGGVLCYAAFVDDRQGAVGELRHRFGGAVLVERSCAAHVEAAQAIEQIGSGGSLNVVMCGTAFQTDVWRELCTIAVGQSVGYGDLAKAIGRPKAVRAVGSAVGRNPIAVIVPCHRVVPASGGLGGYAGGTERKRMLLEREAAFLKQL